MMNANDSLDQAMHLLTELLDDVPSDPALRDRLLTELRGPQRYAPHAPTVADLFGLSRSDALMALVRIQTQGDWAPGPWPGSSLLRTAPLTTVHALIARLPVGVAIPMHRHRCIERTYVLDGILIEDESVVHRSASILVREPGSSHALRVGEDECLVVLSIG